MNFYIRHFSREMLPQLGVRWHWFATLKEAEAFAKWAERVTRNSQRPCEADINERDERPANERFEVRVRNW